MTLNEFKAWLSGFSEGMHGAPTDAQWVKIKKRIEEIDNVATPQTLFIDRYIPHNPYVWPNSIGSGYGIIDNPASLPAAITGAAGNIVNNSWNSSDAFLQLGKADAA